MSLNRIITPAIGLAAGLTLGYLLWNNPRPSQPNVQINRMDHATYQEFEGSKKGRNHCSNINTKYYTALEILPKDPWTEYMDHKGGLRRAKGNEFIGYKLSVISCGGKHVYNAKIKINGKDYQAPFNLRGKTGTEFRITTLDKRYGNESLDFELRKYLEISVSIQETKRDSADMAIYSTLTPFKSIKRGTHYYFEDKTKFLLKL